MIADRGQLPPDDFDALADLFLGEVDIPCPTTAPAVRPSAPPPPRQSVPAEEPAVRDQLKPIHSVHPARLTPAAELKLEAVLLEHVPLMPASWASQYARYRAEITAAPVAILRVSSAWLRIELIGAVAPAPAPAQTIDDALAAARSATSTLQLVTSDAAARDELAATCDLLTMLTTPDEAGTVAGYSALKHLAKANPSTATRAPKPMRVVMVGADSSRGTTAWRKLRDAAASFLESQLDQPICIDRLTGGSPSTVLFDGPFAGTIPALARLIRSASASGGTSSPRPVSNSPSQSEGAEGWARSPIEAPQSPSTSGSGGTGSLLPVSSVPFGAHSGIGEPTTATPPAPRKEQQPDPTILTQLPSLRPLPARCPHAEQVEIGFDAEGRLHAAILADEGHESHAAASLLAAGAWATVNRRLLALIAPDDTTITADAPTLHLFTQRPAAVRGLLDTHLKLHVLVKPPPTTISSSVAVPLN